MQEKLNDAVSADSIRRQQQQLAAAYNSGNSYRWANLVANIVIFISKAWDLSGPLASKAWSNMVADIQGALSESCPIIEEMDSRIESYPIKEARWKNTILFVQALESLGIAHEFTPEFIKKLLIYKLEKE